MAAEYKMDAKTFLSFKTCKFNYFLIFLRNCLNLANFSFYTKKKFLKNSKWLKISIWQILYTQIHEFLVAEPLDEMF
jgi:hypothetical protein